MNPVLWSSNAATFIVFIGPNSWPALCNSDDDIDGPRDWGCRYRQILSLKLLTDLGVGEQREQPRSANYISDQRRSD
jgi:hypothetical protein